MTYLCIIDNSEELSAAIKYASSEAKQHQTDVAFLYAMEPIGVQQWASVEETMREENIANANETTNKWALVVENLTGSRPIMHIKEGKVMESLKETLQDDAICHLVLAAGKGENPIIQNVVCQSKQVLNVPLTIVPLAV